MRGLKAAVMGTVSSFLLAACPSEGPGPAAPVVQPQPGDHTLTLVVRAYVPRPGGLGELTEGVVKLHLSVTAVNGAGRPLLADDMKPMRDWAVTQDSPIELVMSQPPDSDNVIKADVWVRGDAPADTIYRCFWKADGVDVLTQVTQRQGSFTGKGAPCRHKMTFN